MRQFSGARARWKKIDNSSADYSRNGVPRITARKVILKKHLFKPILHGKRGIALQFGEKNVVTKNTAEILSLTPTTTE